MPLTNWLKQLFLIFLGLTILFITYALYQSYKEDGYIQQHSPRTKMVIVGRYKGLGTIRYPNHIYLYYRGKRYSLPCPNAYFREIAQLDSITVHYDSARDKVVLAEVNARIPYGLLLLIAVTGLLMLLVTINNLRRQLTT